jgi:hypothetical protein
MLPESHAARHVVADDTRREEQLTRVQARKASAGAALDLQEGARFRKQE